MSSVRNRRIDHDTRALSDWRAGAAQGAKRSMLILRPSEPPPFE
ncbi:MAG: hypothetical protein OJF51_002201 [Nitrospira sp.]|nr:MAG: hypothetical protein OJF51_002201 [Nitrospira sp.]